MADARRKSRTPSEKHEKCVEFAIVPLLTAAAPRHVCMKSFSLFNSLPNLITLGRLVLVPVAIDRIANQAWIGAFAVFSAASLSDAVDGYLARRFALRSELGALLDPLADKALLVSIYVALAVVAVVPTALTILVVSRDVMIVGAVLISWVMEKPIKIKPLLISKLNTTAQIAFAGLVLGAQAFQLTLGSVARFRHCRGGRIDARIDGCLSGTMATPHEWLELSVERFPAAANRSIFARTVPAPHETTNPASGRSDAARTARRPLADRPCGDCGSALPTE